MRALLVLFAMLAALPAWAFRQQVVLCRDGADWQARPAQAALARKDCQPLDAEALHARAKKGDAEALAALLAVVETTRVLPPFRVAAARALAWPAGKSPPENLLARAEAAFVSHRIPFRAAIALADFLGGLRKVPAPPAALWPGLRWRLTKAETCPVAARLLVLAGPQAREGMVQTWLASWKSDEVTRCIERALAPYTARLVPRLADAARQANDARLRMRLINWMVLAGDAARPALEGLRNDPDARVRRLVASYLDGQ